MCVWRKSSAVLQVKSVQILRRSPLNVHPNASRARALCVFGLEKQRVLCLWPWQGQSRLHAGGHSGRGRTLRSRAEKSPRGSVVPVQVLVVVPAWWSSETHRGEAEAGETAARAGDDFLLLQRVPAARTKRRRAGRVGDRGAVAVVFGPAGSTGGGVPSQGTTCDRVVVVQLRETGKAGRSIGNGRPPAVLEGRG